MEYEFTKMQSLGNDFILLDGVSGELNFSGETARRMADRHFGVGCDQVLLVERAEAGQGKDRAEFFLRIFNQDGSEAGQCGNGARCVGRFLYDSGLVKNKEIRVDTCTTAMILTLNDDDSVRVEMGAPEFSPEKIPFHAPAPADTYDLKVDGGTLEISAVSMGNPHAVLRVDDAAAAPVATLGPRIENHSHFAERANVGFMQIAARDHIILRVYERGVGETLGCGSGACAAVAVGVNLGLLDQRVTVSLPGGDAEVAWQGGFHPVYLTGPAHTVFAGSIKL